MRTLRTVAVVALALLAGCAGTSNPFREDVAKVPVRATKPDASRLGEISRVMILPLRAESGFEDQVVVVTDRLARELQRGRFTVVPAPSARESAEMLRGVRSHGRIEAKDLIKLDEQYRIDAVIVGAITHYDPYDPQVLGLDLSLISTRTASTIWRVSQVFDASRDDIAADAVAWYEKEVAGADAPFGPEVVLLSPKAFAHYACRRVAETLESPDPKVASSR